MRSVIAVAIRGYLAALIAGNLVFWAMGLIRAMVFGPYPEDGAEPAGFFVVAVLIFVVSLVTTILPFIVFVAIALMLGVRGFAYFMVCGGAMGLFVTALLIGTRGQIWAVNPTLWQDLSVSGALGGLVYWWISVKGSAESDDIPGLA